MIRRAMQREPALRRCHKLAVVAVAAGVAALPGQALAEGPFGPLNDLAALGQGGGQTPVKVPNQQPPEPPQTATPRPHCGPGSGPEPGTQGRQPAGSAANGSCAHAT